MGSGNARRLSPERRIAGLVLGLAAGALFAACCLAGLARAETGPYSIHVATCKDLESATIKIGELKALGHRAFYREEREGKEKCFRVYVEEFKTKAEAEKEAMALKELGLLSDYSIRPLPAQGQGGDEKKRRGKEKGNGIFYLHVYSFKEKGNAEKATEDMKKQGHKAFHVLEEASGEQWYRVYIGQFPSEGEARKAGGELKRKGVISYFKPIGMDRSASPKEKGAGP